ncbi:hypothetical protein PoB_005498200 [Plakobranchus ocellatus]|uniref:Uncharacterized protein n=1 Tax=Plakobranchus ocellatus TaxID=259542 RepID=A0AAV4CAT4_9GAST|nr:hypothetical protein PoB_005498200 [Plakobranchus ocellatus]
MAISSLLLSVMILLLLIECPCGLGEETGKIYGYLKRLPLLSHRGSLRIAKKSDTGAAPPNPVPPPVQVPNNNLGRNVP